MARYRKKPVVIEAVPWLGDVAAMHRFMDASVVTWGPSETPGQPVLYIKTLEGEMRADYGDFIIKGVKGEFYPCKPDIFEQTYETSWETNGEERPYAS